ncbi:MAG: hypothetical protein A2Z42_03850 [Candidatus Woykebacteria bacterium RBG_19FT_COMBO_43_10]|uniref:Uncharacterized protein n=1 Tax=Candidatus Woykebacteria bacterium RBG_19FT_COMBO_43_10 TaxID=1802598 RepID=A0A1G1WKD7_9BACT|nr:MAG: hypothetical protein A2Z42_03850 [Candidatus Woykebacteria bacterium RBG_19FT_COMBO_43_10]
MADFLAIIDRGPNGEGGVLFYNLNTPYQEWKVFPSVEAAQNYVAEINALIERTQRVSHGGVVIDLSEFWSQPEIKSPGVSGDIYRNKVKARPQGTYPKQTFY